MRRSSGYHYDEMPGEKKRYDVVGSELNISCYDEAGFCCLVFVDVTGTNYRACK